MSVKYYKVSTLDLGEIAIHMQGFKAMAKAALKDIKDVAQTFETITPTIADTFNSKKHRNGVEVEFEADGVIIDVYLTLKATANIVTVGRKVQVAIHEMIENMTSMKAKAVYVHVVRIDF